MADSIYFSKEASKRKDYLCLNWLLKVGQADLSGLTSDYKRAAFLFKEIHGELFPPKKQIIKRKKKEEEVYLTGVPNEVFSRFGIRFYSNEKNSIRSKLEGECDPETPIKEDGGANQLIDDASKFLVGLAQFIDNIKEKGSILEVGFIKSAKSRRLILKNKRYTFSYTWEKTEHMGPNIFLDLLYNSHENSFGKCPLCNSLFYETHSQKKYCSEECAKKANQKLKQKKPEYKEYRKLVNQRDNWRTKKKSEKGKAKKEILTRLAAHWRMKNVSEARIKQLLFPKSDES